jgi:ATP-dependent helicase HepA
MGPAILARVPADLDALMEQAVANAATGLGFGVVEVRDSRTYAIEFGNEAVIDALPGVAAGASFVGTFDREHAVENETIDFFASGHPLVEGLLAHFAEDPKGRVARLEVRLPGQPGTGLVVIYKQGPDLDVVALDVDGHVRADWAEAFRHQPLRARRMSPDDVAAHDWAAIVTRLGATLDARTPHALAAVVVRSL